MARRKNVKQDTQKITLDIPASSDLPLRLKKIAKQTGLSHFNLIQKWILQEESLLGLMLYGKKQMAGLSGTTMKAAARKISVDKEQKEAASINPENPDYRGVLAQRIKKLRKEGKTLKWIAETFNDEKIPTVSGTGKWYTSSISWLMNSKAR